METTKLMLMRYCILLQAVRALCEWISYLNLLVTHFKFVDSDFDVINLSDVLALRDW